MLKSRDMEIEIKVLNIDPPSVRQKLKELGATYQGREFQRNHMYDYADQRLYREHDGSYIRLRQRYWPDTQQAEVLLTLKQTISRDKYKIAEETESTVGDFQALNQFLVKLGFIQTRIDEKLRETWLLDDLHLEIDQWAGLPPYLEIEAASEDAVQRGLNLLGYSAEQSTSANLTEVLAQYGITAKDLRFADFGQVLDFEI